MSEVRTIDINAEGGTVKTETIYKLVAVNNDAVFKTDPESCQEGMHILAGDLFRELGRPESIALRIVPHVTDLADIEG